MKRTSTLRTVLMFAAFLAASVDAQSLDTPTEVVRAFHAALAAGDSSRALGLLSPTVVIYESGGVEASREEYRSHHLGADMMFARATKREVSKQSAAESGDVAWVISQSATSGTFRDREVNSHGTETMILERTAQGWRITHVHWSSRRQQAGS